MGEKTRECPNCRYPIKCGQYRCPRCQQILEVGCDQCDECSILNLAGLFKKKSKKGS